MTDFNGLSALLVFDGDHPHTASSLFGPTANPVAMTFDEEGNIWVADGNNWEPSRIKYDSAGNILVWWYGRGDKDLELSADQLTMESLEGFSLLPPYDVDGRDSWFSMDLAPDGATFWAADARVALNAALALNDLEQAALFLDPFTVPIPQTETALALLQNALTRLQTARDILEDAMGAGTEAPEGSDGPAGEALLPSTEWKLASRSIKRGPARGQKGLKVGNRLLAQGSSKTVSLAKRIRAATWQALLLRAQLFGFKSKSIGHDFKTLEVNVTTSPF